MLPHRQAFVTLIIAELKVSETKPHEEEQAYFPSQFESAVCLSRKSQQQEQQVTGHTESAVRSVG